jgi:hypothetical protein
MYGYAFGVGRLVFLLDEPDIHRMAVAQLTGLGVGEKYAVGLIDAAREAMLYETAESTHRKLVGIGHWHFASENLTGLADTVFRNTMVLRSGMA